MNEIAESIELTKELSEKIILALERRKQKVHKWKSKMDFICQK
jgi:hypothetical protein